MFGKMFVASKVQRILAVSAVLMGLLASSEAARADTLPGQPIYAQNNTSRTIYVAARYMPPGSPNYVADGFWRINPGERKLLLYNNGVYMYFYARDGQGRVWSGNDARATVRGETLNMFSFFTDHDYDPRTFHFDP